MPDSSAGRLTSTTHLSILTRMRRHAESTDETPALENSAGLTHHDALGAQHIPWRGRGGQQM